MIVFEPWVDLRAMINQTHEHKFAGNKRLCLVPDVKYKCISWCVTPHSCPCVRHICASTTWTYPKCTCTINFRTRDHLNGTHCFSPMSPLVVPGGSQKKFPDQMGVQFLQYVLGLPQGFRHAENSRCPPPKKKKKAPNYHNLHCQRDLHSHCPTVMEHRSTSNLRTLNVASKSHNSTTAFLQTPWWTSPRN